MEAVTFNDLVRLAAAIMAIWAFCKIVMEIVHAIVARHDKEKKWDETADDLRKERQDDMCQYNEQLRDIRQKQDEIRTDFEAKVQEIKAEQYVIIDCLKAILDGLHQQGCNGAVTEAINGLDEYLNKRAHK